VVNFEFNSEGFRRGMDEALSGALRDMAERIQVVLDSVLGESSGMALELVRELLVNKWEAEFGTTVSDPELGAYAAQIAAGNRIIVQVDGNFSSM